MKIRIDFSIFYSPNKAYANVSGEIDLPSIPQIGSNISFLFALKNIVWSKKMSGFTTSLKVSEVTFIPKIIGEDKVIENEELLANAVALHLEDVTVSTIEEAIELMKYFEDGFNLIGWPINEEEE